jgi:hypothetical protein
MSEINSYDAPSKKWWTIPLTVLTSLIIGVCVALITDYIRTPATKLEYEIISSSTFSGQVQKLEMVAIEIQNTGQKELELVTVRIQVKETKILESKTED